MRRSLTLLAGVATATALLASGCGAGQIAETAEMKPAVPGTNGQLDVAQNQSLSVRNAMVAYDGSEGYQVGADAPLEVWIFNDTSETVSVTVSTPNAKAVTLSGGETASPSPSPSPAESASPSPDASGSPAPSPSPEAPPAPEPASIEIAAGSFAAFSESTKQHLVLTGLTEELKPGETVELTFDFGNGRTLKLDVPVGTPLSPAPRASAETDEGEH
ncbi:copper chaperone PCu(A)C [Phytohabitans rumicis]|uniref:copper chaperone PCu(A)C n=1 Tax=Phytohabitans rumicis TaxID=1076125 RepID=UPI0031F1B2F8